MINKAKYTKNLTSPPSSQLKQLAPRSQKWREEWWGEEEEYWEEEGEYASYHTVGESGNNEAHFEPAILVQPLDGEAGKGEEAATLGSAVPHCKGSERPCASPARGGEGTCKSCRRRRRSTKVNVLTRTTYGSWQKVFDAYCGIVGGAALTPGVDVFDTPAEVGCAGYGAYRAVEAIVEAL